ncbi:MAG: class I SAM-dependent methyltransferase [Cyclobacteriaceae bacterium]|nr:class I SAM-dependent methyltransferase [Cyclobacteriaceae bacterium]
MEEILHCPACNLPSFTPFVQTAAMMHQHLPTIYNFDRCNHCGLVFLNPRVPEAELSRFYTAAYLPYRSEKAWGKYASFVKKDQQTIDRERVKRVKKYHYLTPQSRILDVGCGKPTFLAMLGKESSAQLIGLDFSDKGWKSDSENFESIDLQKGEITDLRGMHPVDVITMWHYLEHDYQPQQNLRLLLEMAHPKTCLIVEVPNFDSYTRRKFGQHWAGYHTPRHTALYSPGNLELMMKNSGWQVERILTYGTLDPYLLHWMSRMEQKGIDWSASMEPRFMDYVAGMVLNAPIYKLLKILSLGFMTVVAKPA